MLKKYRKQRESIFTLTKKRAQEMQTRNKEVFDKSYFGFIYKNKAECEKC